MGSDIPTPGGAVARRILHFIWIVDCSSSMGGKKIQTVNTAIREALPMVLEAMNGHPGVQMQMRAIRFADEACWQVGPEPVPIEQFRWTDLSAKGQTSTAQALHLLADALDVEHMHRRGFPPICVLLSDGYCTDDPKDYDQAIQQLVSQPWGRRAVRVAIGIGADFGVEELEKFSSDRTLGVLTATNVDQLVTLIRWASVAVSVAASRGRSKTPEDGEAATNVQLPPPPQSDSANADVF